LVQTTFSFSPVIYRPPRSLAQLNIVTHGKLADILKEYIKRAILLNSGITCPISSIEKNYSPQYLLIF
jgi:hypothetical protein